MGPGHHPLKEAHHGPRQPGTSGRPDRAHHRSHSGIGKATAAGLAAMGAHVPVAGRDPQRTEAAAREIRSAGGGPVDAFVADLSAQAEVHRLADEVHQRLPRLHELINNVGGYWNTRHVTADGFERTFGLNHLAPFLLTDLLLDRLRESSPARVFTVSSHAHASGQIDFDDLQGERGYSGARAYNQSSWRTFSSPTSWLGDWSAPRSPRTRSTPA